MILTHDIGMAAEILGRGDVVLVPTETVYGLAGDANSVKAVEKIFAIKRRPREVVLPVMVKDLAAALELTGDENAKGRLSALGKVFWPGPLTMVVPLKEDAPLGAFRGQKTIGIRCPDQSQLLLLLESFGPLAVTSANLHGQPPIKNPEEGGTIFDGDLVCVDGGICRGQPSTVVSLVFDEPEILREGPISLEQIKEVWGSV